MNEARTLHQLQTIDLETDALTQEAEDVEAQMGETEELIDARGRLDDARQRLHNLQTAQQELEWEVERLSQKIEHEESQMYRGQGRGPRELDALRREVENLKKSRREVEDRILEIMAEAEQVQDQVAESQAELAQIVAEWEETQRALAERQSAIKDRLAQLSQARQGIAVQVPATVMAIYEDLRRSKHGRAVARIERNTCQGCRISLPMSTVQHARSGRELVYCPSCGRILLG